MNFSDSKIKTKVHHDFTPIPQAIVIQAQKGSVKTLTPIKGI